MLRKFSALRATVSPEALARVAARAEAMLLELRHPEKRRAPTESARTSGSGAVPNPGRREKA